MHTPGHAVVNLALLGSSVGPELGAPILAGAVIPDLPIFFLYLRERVLRGTPEDRIWSDHYQRPFWQNLIHGLHSMPLALGGLLISLAAGAPAIAAFFASAAIHAASDLPIHGEDAHRHFFPFSNYRFISPLSYWDVRRHGTWVALAELVLVFACTPIVWERSDHPLARVALGAILLWYLANYWRTFVRPALQRRESRDPT